MSSIDWNTGSPSSLISIGTHSLYLSTSGTTRSPGEPTILLMQGLGSTIAEWVAIPRLTPFARWVQYDRSGLGLSQEPPSPSTVRTASSVASELDTLLRTTAIEGPFIVVCHSWGGITAREFLHLREKEIVGMVFVDANTEETFDGGDGWPLPFITAMTEGRDWAVGSGLEDAQVLPPEEWDLVKKSWNEEKCQRTEKAESGGFKGDGKVLRAKRQIEERILGDRPVSVIKANTGRDFERMYRAGVEAGKGTEEDRKAFRDYLENFNREWTRSQRELLKLSRNSRFIEVEDSGHNVQLVQPAIIAREIRWVWDNVAIGARQS